MGWFDRIFGNGNRHQEASSLPAGDNRALKTLLDEVALPTYFLTSGARSSRSYLGGMPMGGEAFEWPRSDAGPLPFVLQVDMEELQTKYGPVEGLPTRGLLQFYYDLGSSVWGGHPSDRDTRAWAVQLVDGEAAQGMDEPEDLNPEYIYPVKKLGMRKGATYPPEPPVLPVADEDVYRDARYDVYRGEPQHQLLGHPLEIQDPRQALHCVRMAWGLSDEDWRRRQPELRPRLNEEIDKWLLLAQIDSDDATQMMWGDVGKLYFWIRKDDLSRRRFERCWMIFECH